MKDNILIVTGETSGDIHAANLVKSLNRIDSNLNFFGMGGKRMEEVGVELTERMERLSIIGVAEIFTKLKEIRSAFKKIMAKVESHPPKVAILIDYPGFNLTLAKMLKRKGVFVVYYITPQVWAWGGFRIHFIKKFVDKAIVILKFEEDLFKKYGIDATFVGHPILDSLKSDIKVDREKYKLTDGKMTVALLPGSRESEVKRILPLMVETAGRLIQKKDVQFVLLKTSSVDENIYTDVLKNLKFPIALMKDKTQECLAMSDFIFLSSGTATLECAIMERPMLITYRITFSTFLLFKIFSRIGNTIGLVNIIAGRSIVPEIAQYDASPDSLTKGILSIISSKNKMDEQVRCLREVKQTLGSPGVSLRAAHIVEEIIKRQR